MRKPRIDSDGPSPLQQLKGLSMEEHEFICGQKEKLSAAKLIAQIEARHGIHGLTPARLSDFWRWLDLQREVLAANEMVQNVREIFAVTMPNASAEETHNFLVKLLTAQAIAAKNERGLQFVTVEERKRIELEQGSRKLALLEKKAEAAKEVLSDNKLTPEEQAAKMREVFGL